jgi:hypothetical protein
MAVRDRMVGSGAAALKASLVTTRAALLEVEDAAAVTMGL